MRGTLLRAAIALALAAMVAPLSGCLMAARAVYKEAARPHHRQDAAPPTVILISIDGFRWDYLDRGVTPNLSALAAGGARAERMIPSFPSLTFPNHYTLVTGLTPDRHGVVNNTFEDPAIPTGTFRLSNAAAVTNRVSWDQATPIWVSAERAGIRTATEFWPGSEADIQGVRPSHYSRYDIATPSDARVAQLLAWLDLPEAERPRFLTVYFDVVDTAGHHHGPDSPEVNAAAAQVDAAIGRLMEGLRQRGRAADLVVVADHGMTSVPLDHRVYVEDWPGGAEARMVTGGSVAGFVPASEANAQQVLGRHDHVDCYRKADIPARFQYGTNARIPPVVCIADLGWSIASRARKDAHASIGEHGFDPEAKDMGGLFIANGPDIRPGVVLKPFPNTDVYPLLARLLRIPPLPNQGRLADLEPALR